LHQKPSGEFGSGKSDAMKNVIHLLPVHKCIEGSMSSKALFYDDGLQTGTIIYTDDAKLSDDIIVTLRAITSDFQEPAVHMTVSKTKDGKMIVDKKMIPPRITIWMSSVGSIQDQQLESRFCFGDTDESEEQDERVNQKQKERVTTTYSFSEDPDVLTCRCIFDIIFQNTYTVYAPLIEAVEWNNKEHRRNFEKFIDLLQAVTVFNFRQRESAHGGLIATIDDYDRALKIYMGAAAKNATNLTGKELQVIEVIQRIPGKTISFTDLLKKTGIKQTTLRYLIDGRNGREGLLGKVAGLYELDRSETIGSDNCKTSTRTKVYKYDGDMFGITSKIYHSVAKIDRELAIKITNDFISNDCENTYNNHNYHTTITDNVIVKNDNIKDNNNNKNSKITKKEENIGANEDNISSETVENDDNNFSDSSKSCDFCDFVIVDPKNDSNSELNKSNCSVIVSDCVVIEYQENESSELNSSNCDTCDNTSLVENKSACDLMKRALKNFAWSDEYHGVVENIPVFVGKFNERTPEYVQSLGLPVVLQNAERLSFRGWK